MRYLFYYWMAIFGFVVLTTTTGCTKLDSRPDGTVELKSVGNSQAMVGKHCSTEREVVEITTKGRDAGEQASATYDGSDGSATAAGDAVIRRQHSKTTASECHIAEGGTQSPTNASWMERIGGLLVGWLLRGGL